MHAIFSKSVITSWYRINLKLLIDTATCNLNCYCYVFLPASLAQALSFEGFCLLNTRFDLNLIAADVCMNARIVNSVVTGDLGRVWGVNHHGRVSV